MALHPTQPLKPRAPTVYAAASTSQNVYELAIDRINHLYRVYDQVVVSFSGGKDSMVALELAIIVAKTLGRLPVEAHFFDEEALNPETVEYLDRLRRRPEVKLFWYCLPIKHRNLGSLLQPYWYPWAPEAQHLWIRPKPEWALTRMQGGYDGVRLEDRKWHADIAHQFTPAGVYGSVAHLIGLRAEESLRRRCIMLGKLQENYITHSTLNVAKAYPIYDWTVADVWTAVKLFGWDYNRTYDVLKAAGVPPSQQRLTGSPWGEEPSRGFWQYAVCWPALWDKMLARVGGTNALMRYAVTRLYGKGIMAEKPADWTWEAYILYLISRQTEQIQPKVRHTVEHWIKFHGRHAAEGEAILAVPHYYSGVDWPFLARLALRGNTKQRANPRGKVVKREAAARATYLHALAIYQQTGQYWTPDADRPAAVDELQFNGVQQAMSANYVEVPA